jgi:hypothetical protein
LSTACFFRLSTLCPSQRLLHRLFLPLVDNLPAVLLTACWICFACLGLDCHAVRRIAHISASLAAPVAPPLAGSLVSLSRSPRRSPDRSSLSVARCAARRIPRFSVLPAAPLAGSLISFSVQRLTYLSIAKGNSLRDFAYSADKSPQCRLQKACLWEGFAAAPPTGSLIPLALPQRRTRHHSSLCLAHHAARRIAHFSASPAAPHAESLVSFPC